VIKLVKLQHCTATELTSNVANNNDLTQSLASAQVHRELEIKSSRDDIIHIIIVVYVCYNTITGYISQHSAVALFNFVCCSK